MGGQSQTTTNKNTSTSYPGWTQDAGQSLFGQAANWLSANPTRPNYGGPLSAAFGSTFDPAKSDLLNMQGQTAQGTQQAGNAFGSVLSALDPSKTASDYMSPYLDQVLNPTIRNINQQADQRRAQIGGQATQAGAFGDTGHALLQSLNDKNTGQQISDATGALYNQAYNTGQNQQNSVIQQMLSGASGMAGVGAQQFGQNTGVDQLLAGLGTTEQQAGQAGVNNGLSQFNLGVNYPMQNYTTLASILRGLPLNTTGTETGTSSAPDNSGLGLFGSLLGYMLPA